MTSLDSNFEVSQSYPNHTLLSTESTVLELVLEANVEYNFDFDLLLDPNSEFALEENFIFFELRQGPLDALSIRVLEKETYRFQELSKKVILGMN